MTIVFILLGMLERSNIPVLSLLGNTIGVVEKDDDPGAKEDATQESESFKELFEKEYLHQFSAYQFAMPVTHIQIEHQAVVQTKFPYCFYPDVPTPPPNC